MATAEIDQSSLDGVLADAGRKIVEEAAYVVEDAQKRLLRMHGSGRVYTTRFFRRGGRLYAIGHRPPHQASAPGESPAADTRRLLNSVHHTIGVDAKGIYADIGTDMSIGIWLELGTRYMAPRPWLRPSLQALRAEENF